MTPPPPYNRKPSPRLPRPLLWAAAVVGVLFILILYGTVDPSTTPMPRCPVKMLTGLDCPGCGSQRALHALLTGQFAKAWAFNPAMIVAIPLLLFLGTAPTIARYLPCVNRVIYSRWLGRAILTVIILWTLFRNLPL